MSLGSTYNNNQNVNRNNEPNVTVFSNYRMNNAESQIDATCLTFKFWRTNLCLGIFPRKNTGNDEVAFDMDNGITIYLSHTKARILSNELKLFLKDPVKYSGNGVPSGSSIVTISNGVEYGKNTPVLTIRKISENDEVLAGFAYEFKRDYYFSVRNYDGKNFDRNYDDYRNLEIEQLITLLDEYVKAATNTIAFTVMDQQKYANNRVNTSLAAIAEKLGVELNTGNKSGYARGGSSYFNNPANGNNSSGYSSSSNVSYGAATIDDLE